MALGKITSLYSDAEKTEALFPRTKTKAISDDNGVGLDAILEHVVYSVPDIIADNNDTVNADTLQGHPASDFATTYDIDQLTYEDVGAAPAGYGLGGNAKLLTSADNLDNTTENGWYAWSDIPQGFSYGGCVMQVKNLTADWLVQEITILVGNEAGCKIIRNRLGGVWQPLEWDNPPMVFGVEYRTTERRNGKAVYTKLVDCQGAVNGGTARLTSENATAIRWSGLLSNNIPLPMLESDFEQNYCELSIYNNNGLECFIRCGGSAVGSNLKVQVWYVK